MNWGRFISFLSAWIFLSPALAAQNLVPNGSFEEYSSCPGSYTGHAVEFRASSWHPLTTGTPDYFNTCSEGEADVPYNWAGVSDPFDGYGYAGIFTYMTYPKEYREYLHCKLSEPLIKDSVYHVSFRYKLSSYSKYTADRIGALLSDSLKQLGHDRPLKIEPSISFVKDSALTPETGAWELARAEYRAKGNEQFLTIGNFAGNQLTQAYYIRSRPASEPMVAHSAYYYIDDVKVVPGFSAMPADGAPGFFPEMEPELNTVYVLKNIQFEFDSHSLMPVSYHDLDKVVAYMLEHPDVSVRLMGHTDDVGDDDYNLRLSASRAASAAAYLGSKGVSERRIATSGYGERQPLVPATTDEAREKNRRVEVEFVHSP